MPRKKAAAAPAKPAAKKRSRAKKDTPAADSLEPSSESAGEILDDKGGQQRLPGHERRGNKAIEKAMEQVKDLEGKRMDFAKKEKEAREFLIGLMEREQIGSYEFDGMTAKINNNKKVSVRVSKDDLDDADEEDWEPEEAAGEAESKSEPEEEVDEELAAGPDDKK